MKVKKDPMSTVPYKRKINKEMDRFSMTVSVLDKKENMKIRFRLRSVVVYIKWNVNIQNYRH